MVKLSDGTWKIPSVGQDWLISAIMRDGKPTIVATLVQEGENPDMRLKDHEQTVKDYDESKK